MSAGGRPVGKITVSHMKPLTSRSQSELSGKNQYIVVVVVMNWSCQCHSLFHASVFLTSSILISLIFIWTAHVTRCLWNLFSTVIGSAAVKIYVPTYCYANVVVFPEVPCEVNRTKTTGIAKKCFYSVFRSTFFCDVNVCTLQLGLLQWKK